MKLMHNTIGLVGAMSFAISAGAQISQQETGMPAPSDAAGHFQKADKDRDGKISREEFDELSKVHGASGGASGQGMPATEHQATLLDNFEDRDKDGDGYITAEEMGTQSGPDR